MKIKFAKNYAYAFHGYEVVKYKAGDVVDTDSEELIKAARADGVLEAEEEEQPKKKAKK